MKRRVFITGGTGYLGKCVIPEILARGHEVVALVRAGSEKKLPSGCLAVSGNALDKSTFVEKISPADTFIQLVGVAHPSPAKARQFREIDLVSARESVGAAVAAKIQHFIYLSVAQPAPIMKAYIEVRAEGERLIREAGLNATIFRPWYILGPGHRWPYFFVPVYRLLEILPATRQSALRLGFVTLRQMVVAMVEAVEKPARGIRVCEVPEIRGIRGN